MVHIQVILGSTREGRFGVRAATWVVERLSTREDLEVELVDMRDHQLPYFDAKPPAFTLRDYPTPEVARLGQTLDRADGYVIVTPEYNHGYPAALKNAIDLTFIEWTRKPVSFVSWGGVGGARAVEQLRLVCIELEMAPLRHAVHILPDVLVPAIQAPEPFDLTLLDALQPRLTKLADDLVWWAGALAAARAATPA
ncbi:MAG: NADPH-dependent reductase [Acidimicrobiales bacterium]|nr:NADPH-dependent reductase [Acidimicrobiales bacterium]